MDRKPRGFLKISLLINVTFSLLACRSAYVSSMSLPHGLQQSGLLSFGSRGMVFLPGTGWDGEGGRGGGSPLEGNRAPSVWPPLLPDPLERVLVWTLITAYISMSVLDLEFHKARSELYVFALSNITSSIYTVCFCSPWCNMTKFQPCASHMQVRAQLGCVAWLR